MLKSGSRARRDAFSRMTATHPPAAEVAETLRTVIAFSAIRVVDDELLLRTVEVYEAHRLDFADAYLVANAERTGIDEVVSFDRAIDRVGTVRRVEPA
jgi:predicted nucleic acid-binding protein